MQKAETDQFGFAFDLNLEQSELLDKHLLVEVLRENQRRRVPTEGLCPVLELDLPDGASAQPKVTRIGLHPLLDRQLIDAQLTIKFQAANVEDQRAGGGAWRTQLVDDPNRNASFREPEGKDQSGRSRTNDENLRRRHGEILGSRASRFRGEEGRKETESTQQVSSVSVDGKA